MNKASRVPDSIRPNLSTYLASYLIQYIFETEANHSKYCRKSREKMLY